MNPHLQFVHLPANFERENLLLTKKTGKLFILDIAIHMQLSDSEMLSANCLPYKSQNYGSYCVVTLLHNEDYYCAGYLFKVS